MNIIDNLLEALAVTPNNVPLRLQVAAMLLQEKRLDEATDQYKQVMAQDPGNYKAHTGLGKVYYEAGKYATAMIVLEEVQHQFTTEDKIIYIKCLLKENAIQDAQQLYKQILDESPGFRDNELDAALRIPAASAAGGDEDDEDQDQFWFMEKPKVNFSDVAGMQKVKDEISIKIIQPLQNPDLYKAFGKKAGGGILLYGPPGCGKTYIAKATAGEINAKFINIGLHDILDMWIGNSEKNLHDIFELARRNTPCVLFFDEADALGASRNDLKQSSMRHVINQFLAELDGVEANNEGVLVMAATNAPWNIDAAFRRPGRFDRIIFVAPPDEPARQDIVQNLLKEKPAGKVDVAKIASNTDGYSGADLNAVVDIATEEKLRESLQKGALQNIETKDLMQALKAHKATTKEWFASARNYALYANETGLYDDILRYMKLNK